MVAGRSGIERDNMDTSVRPCDDFFRYANGMWLDRTPIPADEPVYGAFTEIRDRNWAMVHDILEDAARDPGPAGSDRQKVGDMYASGMDEAAIEAAGTAPLAPELERIDRLADRDELPALLAALHAAGSRAGFGVFVRPDPKDSRTNVAHLQQAGLGLPDRDYYLRDDAKSEEIRAAYTRHVARMHELLGANATDAQRSADTVVSLESRLARASMQRVDQRDPYKTYHKTRISRLMEDAPGFDWNGYLASLGAPPLEEVNVRQPDFARELAAASADVPIDQWKIYLRWHLIRSAAPLLGTRFVDESFAFNGALLQGVKEKHPRWRRVAERVDADLGEALGQLFVERVFPPEAKRRVLQLVDDLRSAFRERIGQLAWMTEATKDQAARKLDAFRVKMGYPDSWRDYSSLAIDRGPYVRNAIRAGEFELRRNLAKLGHPVDREEWHMSPPTVNAYYNASMNEIVFPAGILQRPFFDVAADDAVNYGAIGVVIGHEMTHGFDDQGSKFDADGNLKDWWTPEDRAAYDARTDLMVKQFEEYEPLPGQRVNGRLTLGENIADLGGVKLALAALRRSAAAASGPDADGFTAEQRFFLGHAQSWRSQIRDDALRVRLNVDPHSPSAYRVNGPLSNLPEFFAAFGCEDGAMRRRDSERPEIW
ncbi:MAG: M13 family metallopeptidase [Candidatus Limnocylindria bacterium]